MHSCILQFTRFCVFFWFLKNAAEAIEYLYSPPDEEAATVIDISIKPPDNWAELDAGDPSEDTVDVGEENVYQLGTKF